jgi:hypothetical protein
MRVLDSVRKAISESFSCSSSQSLHKYRNGTASRMPPKGAWVGMCLFADFKIKYCRLPAFLKISSCDGFHDNYFLLSGASSNWAPSEQLERTPGNITSIFVKLYGRLQCPRVFRIRVVVVRSLLHRERRIKPSVSILQASPAQAT